MHLECWQPECERVCRKEEKDARGLTSHLSRQPGTFVKMARLTELPAAPAKSSKAAKPTKDPAAPVAPTSAEEPDPLAFLSAVLTSQEYFTTIASLLLLSELVLSAAIVHYVPYTEIDWTTYQQQVASFLGGERDYSLIKGSTGPLVLVLLASL